MHASLPPLNTAVDGGVLLHTHAGARLSKSARKLNIEKCRKVTIKFICWRTSSRLPTKSSVAYYKMPHLLLAGVVWTSQYAFVCASWPSARQCLAADQLRHRRRCRALTKEVIRSKLQHCSPGFNARISPPCLRVGSALSKLLL